MVDNARLDFGEYGTTGLNRYGGYVYEEFLRELQGGRATKVYREMSSNDPTVGAILFAIEMLIRGVEWTVEPASSDERDVAAADFLASCKDDMSHSWTSFVAEALSMLPFGWSYHELVYKVRGGPDQDDGAYRSRFADGRIGWRKLPIRAQETLWQWEFDESGGLRGLVQQAPPDYRLRFVPIEKALLFRTTTHKANPEGRSVLRNAYRPWWFKKRIENYEAIGVERDLAGLPVMWVPPEILDQNATADQKAIRGQLERIVTNIRRDEQEGMLMPLDYDDGGNKRYDLTLLSTGSRRQFDTGAIVTRYDQRIAMTVLADFILLGHEKVGSFALSSSKTAMFATAIGAWLGEIADVLNRFAVPRLFALNDFAVEALPKFVHGDIESVELEALGTFVSQLAGAGAQLFPNPELEKHLMRQAGLPTTQE